MKINHPSTLGNQSPSSTSCLTNQPSKLIEPNDPSRVTTVKCTGFDAQHAGNAGNAVQRHIAVQLVLVRFKVVVPFDTKATSRRKLLRTEDAALTKSL